MAMKTIKIQVPMSRTEFRGRSKQIKGKVREKIGKLRHRRGAQLKGKLEQAEGVARVKMARVLRKAKMRL